MLGYIGSGNAWRYRNYDAERRQRYQNRNRIALWFDAESNTWLARFLGDHAQEVIDAFGTDTIPTPFTGNASTEKVLSEIRERNPEVRSNDIYIV